MMTSTQVQSISSHFEMNCFQESDKLSQAMQMWVSSMNQADLWGNFSALPTGRMCFLSFKRKRKLFLLIGGVKESGQAMQLSCHFQTSKSAECFILYLG